MRKAAISADSHIIRVLVADDDHFIREGLMGLLLEDPAIEVVGTAEDGEDAVSLAQQLRPDVVIMDLSMPVFDGVAATREIVTRLPETAVLVLSVYSDVERAHEVVDAGAMGYVVKAGAQRYLVSAVYALADGNVFFSPGISGKLLEKLRGTTP